MSSNDHQYGAYERQYITDKHGGNGYVYVKHPSGLDIYLWQMNGFTTTDALFTAKYGSINNRFKTSDDEDFIQVPEGIAHFLEHKLFENEDRDVFELYAKTGAMGNAYTSFDHTAYLFSCTENYAESLRILLSFVQDPYFTEETVDKEQGIIGQEIKMCEDNPDRQSFYDLLKCLYVVHPVKTDIAGTVESIAKITPELLYQCYNTFYNLNNMVLTIAGNIDIDEVLKICDEELVRAEDIDLLSDLGSEPDEVAQKEIVRKFPVGQSIFNIGYKCKPYSGRECVRMSYESSILMELAAGPTSKLYNKLTEEGLINSSFSYECFYGNGFFCNIFSGESSDPIAVQKRINEEIDRIISQGIDRERFEIAKKAKYGSMIRGFDKVDMCAEMLLSSALMGVSVFDSIDIFTQMTFEDIVRDMPKLFDKERSAIAVVEPADKQNK